MTWRHELDAIITRQEPFSWGRWDCYLRCAEAVLAKSGIDIAADVRGRYDDMHGALRLLREQGCETPADLVAKHLPEVQRLRAMPGDIAEVPSDELTGALGIVTWGRVSVLSFSGPGFVPLTDAVRVFRA